MSATWRDFVQDTIGDDRQIDAATKTGIDQTTISRWLTDEEWQVSPKTLRAFVTAYDAPVLQAFVAAGFLTATEANQRDARIDLRAVPWSRLMREVTRRLKEADPAAAA